MKKSLIVISLAPIIANVVCAQGLYDIAPSDEIKEDSPLSWSAGLSYSYDDNVSPTIASGNQGADDKASSINAYVGAAFVSITPQTTWDVFARL